MVTMNANMKVSYQCRIAASKDNQVLGIILRNVTYKDKSFFQFNSMSLFQNITSIYNISILHPYKSLIVPLYKPIVRPQLEYT